jgi:hypothetical protein
LKPWQKLKEQRDENSPGYGNNGWGKVERQGMLIVLHTGRFGMAVINSQGMTGMYQLGQSL